MNKTSIKVIKREEAIVAANNKIQSVPEQEQTALSSAKKTESRSRCEITATVSNWISERRKNSRIEEIAAIGKMFGGKSPSSEI